MERTFEQETNDDYRKRLRDALTQIIDLEMRIERMVGQARRLDMENEDLRARPKEADGE